MGLHGMARGVAALLADWPYTPDMVVGIGATLLP
jgi:hypothetical protein